MKTHLRKRIALVLVTLIVLSLSASLAESAYTAPEYPWDFVKKLPKKAAKYLEEVEHHGTVERLTYTTHSYALEAVAAGTAVKAADDNDTTPAIDRVGRDVLLFENEWSIRLALENNEGLVLAETADRTDADVME